MVLELPIEVVSDLLEFLLDVVGMVEDGEVEEGGAEFFLLGFDFGFLFVIGNCV